MPSIPAAWFRNHVGSNTACSLLVAESTVKHNSYSDLRVCKNKDTSRCKIDPSFD